MKVFPAQSAIENIEKMDSINKGLAQLNVSEEKILRMRFGLDSDKKEHTYDEIATYFGLTRERIRQKEARALAKLRKPNKNKFFKEVFHGD